MTATPQQDPRTVTPEGEPVRVLIQGGVIQSSVTDADDPGTLREIMSLARPPHPAPLVSVNQFTIRPGRISRPGTIKGWHVHHPYTFEDRKGW